MLSTLITSKARVALLTHFVTHPGERFYQSQLIRDLGLSSSLVQSELKKLESIGFVTSTRESNTRFYLVNQAFPLYSELKSIIYKTVGLADVLKSSLDSIGDIEIALIFGSVARDLEDLNSDIDVLLIGDIDLDAVHVVLDEAERELGREINPVTFTRGEWMSRVAAHQAFAVGILANPKIILIGDELELREPIA